MSNITNSAPLSRAGQAWQTQVADSARPASLIPGSTLRSSISANGLINSQEMFKAFFKSEVAGIAGGMGGTTAAGFSEIAESGLKAILDKTFGSMTTELLDTGTIKDATSMMKAAHAEALDTLATLRAVASDVSGAGTDGPRSHVPQLVKGSDGYNLIRTAPKIENIVLKGGGAKGAGYPGALAEMHKSGALSNLKNVVGTSAGALTAVSLAAGQSPERFEALANQNALALMHGGSELRDVYPEIGFKNGISPMQALPMIKLLDQVLCEEVKSFVDQLSAGDLEARVDEHVAANPGADKEAILARLQTLANPDFSSDRTGGMVTFNDMKLLNQLEPQKFKTITLTGWDSQTQTPIMFRAGDRYGDLPVAFAARASMAHPLIATGITLPERYGHGDHAIQDGGIGSNMPSEAFYGDDRDMASKDSHGDLALQETRSRTAVLIFDEEGGAYKTMHDPSARLTTPKDVGWIDKKVAHNARLGEDNRWDDRKQYGAGPNGFVIAHGTMGTLSIKASDEEKQAANLQSREVMIEQLALRQDQAYAVEVDSPAAAYALLDRDDRRAIYDQGPPRLTNTTTEANHRAAQDLFELARADFEGGRAEVA